MLVKGDRISRWIVDEVVSMGTPLHCVCHEPSDPTQRVLVKVAPRKRRRVSGGLRAEANSLRLFDHPVIPTLISAGEDRAHGAYYLATSAFEGSSIADRLITGPLDWREACRVFRQVADGLNHVHSHSVIHRDVTPQKILIGEDGRAHLVGFELSMDETRLSQMANAPLGAMAYVAPEVIADPEHLGVRAYLYSLGVVFYEALTGRTAFPAAFWGERPAPGAHVLEWKTKARALDPGEAVPSWLSNLVRKATNPDPEKRLPDLDAMVGWLDAAQASWFQPSAPRTPPPLPRAQAEPPPLQMVAPSIAAPPVQPANVGPPIALLHLAAAVLGMVAAMGFASLVVLFVELAA